MAVRTSYSQNSTYKECPQHWHWKYKEKLIAPEMGASLYFGSAVDEAVMAMLDKKDNYLEIFHQNWHTHTNRKNEKEQIFDDELVLYSYNDFDADLMGTKEITQLTEWAKELKLTNNDPIELFKSIVSIKKNKYKKMTKSQKKYFNRANWLCLDVKGEILVNSFKDQFLPKIKKVYATQKFGRVTDPNTGDTILGAMDFVAEIEGYEGPIILDLKTAARPYTQDHIKFSEQLPLYAAMFSDQYQTNLVGYVVLVKNINKNKTAKCKSCGSIKTSSHRTCDYEYDNGKRCHGEWDEVIEIAPEVQTLITTVPDERINSILVDYGNIIEAMRQEIVYKNTNKCTNWYGGLCPYFKACHENDISGLKKK